MKQFFILLKDNLAQALKSKKSILFLILYFTVFALVVHGIKEAQREIFEQLALQGGMDPELYRLGFNFMIEFLQINSSEIVRNFLSIPLYSIELFAVMLFGTPLLILLVHYDKLAQESSDGTLRYQLFRTSRASIYWAKFASMVIEIALITFLATLLAVAYGHYSLNFFQTGDVLKASLKYWATGLMPLVTFSSLVFLFSAWVKRPFLALLFSVAAVIGALVIMLWYPNLSPFHLDYWKGFFLPGSTFMLQSILIYLGFTLVLLGLGYFIFKKRDL